MKLVLYKRLLSSLIVAWISSTAIFALIHMAPGDPSAVMVNPNIPVSVAEQYRAHYGFDQPLHIQYLRWLQGIVMLDFGYSFSYREAVSTVLNRTLPPTIMLTLSALLFQLLISIPLGILFVSRGWKRAFNWLDGTLLTLYSMPSFWVGLMAIYLFSLKLGWLPSGQMNSFGQGEGAGFAIADQLIHLVMPAVVLAIPFAAQTLRLVYNSLQETLQQSFVTSMIARGMARKWIIRKYCLKNSLIPVVSLLGVQFPMLFGGAVVVETVFAWPGMGRLAVAALLSHDHPLILGSTVVAVVAVLAGNLLADLANTWIDPRLRGEL